MAGESRPRHQDKITDGVGYVMGNDPIAQLVRRWQYDGCAEKDEAEKRMLDNDGDPIKAMCIFHSAARKLQCVKEMRQAIEEETGMKV